jgi:hypothetical protein
MPMQSVKIQDVPELAELGVKKMIMCGVTDETTARRMARYVAKVLKEDDAKEQAQAK